MTPRTTTWASLVAAAFTGLGPEYPTARAQSGMTTPVRPTAFDVYGNARPLLPDRRIPGIYPGSPTMRTPQLYGPTRRSLRRQGQFVPFALPGDVLLGATPFARAPRTPATPSTALPMPSFSTRTQTISRSTRQALTRYGGFTRRQTTPRQGTALDAFSRRYGLVRATSFTAPVLRAYQTHPRVSQLAGGVEQIPFLAEEPHAVETESTLDEVLVRDVRVSHERVRADAWAWFAEQRYRRAARAFETVYMLDPDDTRARIGELFCYVSLRTPNTAVAILDQINGRLDNPFTSRFNAADRYSSREEAARARIDLRAAATRAAAPAPLKALNAFVLWYLGQRDEALLAADAAANAPGGEDYVDWSAKMRAAADARRTEG